ncbi:MAG TPA: hypothetical protein VFF06_28460 [Polyangia bacterium]|nr:hypothetical protein [Polyangia bacterium]
MNVPTWFLYMGGFSLMVLGGLQIQQRPHEKGDGFYKRFVNVGTMWSLCCITVGALLVLMALGWIDPHLTSPPPKLPRRR